MTKASRALVRDTPLPSSREQNRLGGAAQLGPLQHHRPGGGLDLQLGVAVAIPDAVTLTTHIAVAAQELGHLGLQCGLHDQPHAQARDLF
jgi:hypothetical protein